MVSPSKSLILGLRWGAFYIGRNSRNRGTDQSEAAAESVAWVMIGQRVAGTIVTVTATVTVTVIVTVIVIVIVTVNVTAGSISWAMDGMCAQGTTVGKDARVSSLVAAAAA